MSNDHAHESGPVEEMRLCPTCRMKVSVWATKCHYCGEEVGRPRKEELKLTLKDLGGESRTTYAPSGNVTGALESFRAEEASEAVAMQARRKKAGILDRLLGRTPPPQPTRRPVPGQTDLDEYSRNLTESILGDMPGSSSVSISRAQLPPAGRPALAEKFGTIALVVMALLVLYFGGNFVWAKASSFIEARNRGDEVNYVNRAREMLAGGAEPIEAFEESMTALGFNNTPENQQIAAEVRALVLKEVDDLMSANPWRKADQDKASAIIQRALKVDADPAVREKFESVSRELNLFKFVLKSIDESGKSATFRLNNSDFEPEVTVEMADRLMDRFIVSRITSREVQLNDDHVSGRRLTIGINEGVRSAY